MKLHYKKFGEGEPVIILHGLMGMLDNWQVPATLITKEGFEVFIVDARNHGHSPHSDDFNYPVMAADLMEFIEDYIDRDPIIIGHSMGGKTAMLFAQQNPEIVKKLVVVDMCPRYYPVHHDLMLKGLFAVDLKILSRRGEVDEILKDYVPEYNTRQFLLKNIYWNEDKQMTWRFNLEVISREIETIGAETYSQKFNGPTLFIRGEKSGYIVQEDEELIARAFPNSQIVTVANAGHWVHADNTEEFLASLFEFIL